VPRPDRNRCQIPSGASSSWAGGASFEPPAADVDALDAPRPRPVRLVGRLACAPVRLAGGGSETSGSFAVARTRRWPPPLAVRVPRGDRPLRVTAVASPAPAAGPSEGDASGVAGVGGVPAAAASIGRRDRREGRGGASLSAAASASAVGSGLEPPREPRDGAPARRRRLPLAGVTRASSAGDAGACGAAAGGDGATVGGSAPAASPS
jgi:hypothetical protein